MENSTTLTSKSTTPVPRSKNSSITGAPTNTNNSTKTPKSGNFLSMLSTLEAQLDKDDLPDMKRISRNNILPRKDKKPEIIKKFIEKSLEPREVESASTKPNIEQSSLLSDMKSDVSSSNNTRTRRRREFNDSWDRVEMYLKKQKSLRDRKGSDRENPTKESEKKVLKVLEKIFDIFATGNFIDNLNGRKLFKIFLLSSLVLVVQLACSKKARVWMIHTLKIFTYVTGISFSAGTLFLLLWKLIRRKSKKFDEENYLVQSKTPKEAPKQTDL